MFKLDFQHLLERAQSALWAVRRKVLLSFILHFILSWSLGLAVAMTSVEAMAQETVRTKPNSSAADRLMYRVLGIETGEPGLRSRSGQVRTTLEEAGIRHCPNYQFEYETCAVSQRAFDLALRTKSAVVGEEFTCPTDKRRTPITQEAFLDSNLNPLCTYVVMRNYQLKNPDPEESSIQFFGGCGIPGAKAVRTCFSRTNHVKVHNAISLASHCFDVDPKLILGKLAAESHLQINAKSGSGAAGNGQIAEIWAKDVQKRGSKFLSQLMMRKDPNCQLLREQIRKHAIKTQAGDCSLATPPHSPLLSTALGVLLYAKSRAEFASLFAQELNLSTKSVDKKASQKQERVDELAEESLSLKDRMKSIGQNLKNLFSRKTKEVDADLTELGEDLKLEKLNPEEIKKMLEQPQLKEALHELSLYSYNVGPGGTRNLYLTFAKSKAGQINRQKMFEGFTGEKGAFSKFLANLKSHKSFVPDLPENIKKEERDQRIAKRRSEIQNYLYTLNTSEEAAGVRSGIQNAIKQIETATEGTGVQCTSSR